MSIQALSWSIKQNCDTPTTKLVLVLLSNYCDENNSCYPSEKHLGKLVGVSDRTVRRSLKYLSENNFIKIKNRLGTSNRYFVSVDTPDTSMDTDVQPPRSPMTTNTKEDTKDKYSVEFEKFWKVYPRKINKYSTMQKFKVVLKDYDFDKLMKATIIFASQVKNSNTEERFIPHGATWLSQKRFIDFENFKWKKTSLNNIAG